VELEQAIYGQHIGPADMQIAAHAMAMNATCVTDNTDEFKRVPGLTLANWRKPR
jgi:tRNA(fMet)-specific endonuclease VapC